MKPMRRSFFAHYPFRCQPHARLDICGCGGRAMGFMPENRFGAGGKRGFCWSQRQAGLAIQPLFGLGFRLRWSGSAVEGIVRIRVWISRQGARFVRIGARFVRIGARFVRIGARFARIGARFARIGARFAREFRVIGADWQVWEAPSPRFSPLPRVSRVWSDGWNRLQ